MQTLVRDYVASFQGSFRKIWDVLSSGDKYYVLLLNVPLYVVRTLKPGDASPDLWALKEMESKQFLDTSPDSVIALPREEEWRYAIYARRNEVGPYVIDYLEFNARLVAELVRVAFHDDVRMYEALLMPYRAHVSGLFAMLYRLQSRGFAFPQNIISAAPWYEMCYRDAVDYIAAPRDEKLDVVARMGLVNLSFEDNGLLPVSENMVDSIHYRCGTLRHEMPLPTGYPVINIPPMWTTRVLVPRQTPRGPSLDVLDGPATLYVEFMLRQQWANIMLDYFAREMPELAEGNRKGTVAPYYRYHVAVGGPTLGPVVFHDNTRMVNRQTSEQVLRAMEEKAYHARERPHEAFQPGNMPTVFCEFGSLIKDIEPEWVESTRGQTL